MEYIISILPIALYLVGIKAMDVLSFTTWRRLSSCIFAGMICCGVAFIGSCETHIDLPWVMPLVEEVFKSLYIIELVYLVSLHIQLSPFHHNIVFFAEAMVYGMAVGAGFALVENILYVSYNDDISMLECMIRGFGTALIHMGCTALVATILVIYNRIKKFPKAVSILTAIFVASLIHFVYNQFFLPPFIQLLVTVVAFIVIFIGLYHIEDRLIARWLDVSIADDIKLLGAIKEGKLDSTHSGQYLIQIKDSFHPEVFFDMLVFLQLYMELSIKAKSRLMLKEAELALPLDAVEHEVDLGRIKELYTLRGNIGLAGLSVLAPLIHVKNADKWVINELL